METQIWQHPVPQFDDDEDDDEDNFLSGNEDTLPPPPGKRLAPVGANDEDEMNNSKDSDKEYSVESSPGFNTKGGSRFWGSSIGGSAATSGCESNGYNKELEEKVKSLERDQDELNTSLMSMTSHFAKVQFRLQQVVSAPAERKEALLVELQQFAFRGIPDISTPRTPLIDDVKSFDYNENDDDKLNEQEVTKNKLALNGISSTGLVPTQPNDEILASQRKKHTELINQLKGQLEDLECYVYESGEGSVPSSILLERQKVVMEQLKSRLNFNMDNIDKLTEDELKAEVDEAVGQLVTPLKMKSHLITQLKTQIEDLEMFIEFLQGEASTLVPVQCTGCGTCSKHTSPTKVGGLKGSQRRPKSFRKRTKSEQEEIRKQTQSILEKAMAVLQLTTLAQFGCGGEQAFYKNSLKNTPKGNHYGDLRAKLEVAVDHILDACSRVECLTDTDCTSRTGSATQESESEGQLDYLISSPEVASLVRKELAVAIRDLMHHGLISGAGRNMVGSIVPFMGCMSAKNASSNTAGGGGGGRSLVHAWDIILKFYALKLGHEYNAAPARKLSQSFGLDLSGSSSGNKQSLLATIGQIIGTHSPYKRSSDAKFKAFICSGLNKRKLIHWLRLILRNQTILETYYSPWSYVSKTGFDDGFKTLERLNTFVFDLPVDVAIKQFQNMNEAF